MFRTGGLLSNIFTLCVIIFLVSVIINPAFFISIIKVILGIGVFLLILRLFC